MDEHTFQIAKDIAVIERTNSLFSWSLHLRNQTLNTLMNKKIVLSAIKKTKRYLDKE